MSGRIHAGRPPACSGGAAVIVVVAVAVACVGVVDVDFDAVGVGGPVGPCLYGHRRDDMIVYGRRRARRR